MKFTRSIKHSNTNSSALKMSIIKFALLTLLAAVAMAQDSASGSGSGSAIDRVDAAVASSAKSGKGKKGRSSSSTVDAVDRVDVSGSGSGSGSADRIDGAGAETVRFHASPPSQHLNPHPATGHAFRCTAPP
jgi:hypothetical protein